MLLFKGREDLIRELSMIESQGLIDSVIGLGKLLILVYCHLKFGLLFSGVSEELNDLRVLLVHAIRWDLL